MRRCSRGWMRGSRRGAMSPATRSAPASRGAAVMRARAAAVCRGGDDGARRVAARARARWRARATRCRVAWAGLDLITAHRRDDGHDRRPRRARACRIRASASGSGRSTTGTTCRELARKPQAVRQVLPELLRDLGAPFPAVWDHFQAAHGPREAARLFAKVLGPARHARLRASWSRRWRPRLADRHAAAAGARAARPAAPARLAPDAVPAALRDLEVPSGCAADYDALAGGGVA